MSTIYFNPVTSIFENRPAGTICVGVPGSGKTFFLLNVAANCLLTSCRVIYIDPKNDALVLKEVDKNVSVIDINDIKPGALNPFRFLKNVDSNVIMSVIKSICGDLTDEQVIDVFPIVQDFVNANRKNLRGTDFLSLANYLYSSESRAAQAVGTVLKINEDTKYGRLIFSRSTDDDFDLDSTSQVISLLGLKLPKTKELSDQEERFSSAIVYLLTKRLREILVEDNSKPTVLIIDEALMVYSNPDIAKIIEEFLALGRSLNVVVVLASQAMSHFPSNIAQFISNKFMFGMSSKEAKLFLDEFDNSDSEYGIDRESVIHYVTNYEVGRCFFIDRKGRGGFVQIKSNLGVTSNPLLKKRKEEKS